MWGEFIPGPLTSGPLGGCPLRLAFGRRCPDSGLQLAVTWSWREMGNHGGSRGGSQTFNINLAEGTVPRGPLRLSRIYSTRPDSPEHSRFIYTVTWFQQESVLMEEKNAFKLKSRTLRGFLGAGFVKMSHVEVSAGSCIWWNRPVFSIVCLAL